MRKTLAFLALLSAVVACGGTDRATAPKVLDNPSLAVDFTPPPAPSDLAAVIADRQGQRVTLTVTWTDNSNFADEYVTCFTFAPEGGTQCAWASDYGAGLGSRTTNVVVPMLAKGTYAMTGFVTRWVTLDGGSRYALNGPSSDPVSVAAK